MSAPYIARPETSAFLNAFHHALAAPLDYPIVFHAWGLGGTGKTTLIRKAQEETQAQTAGSVRFTEVSFGLTEKADEPIPLMATLYEQLVPNDDWLSDGFWAVYNQYYETINKLETTAVSGRGTVGDTQIAQVKQLLKFGVNVAGEWSRLETLKEQGNRWVDGGVDAAVSLLSLKDLLQQHRATKKNLDLQKLMLDPLTHLTKAFVDGLSHQSKNSPVVLVFDTYEKAPSSVDSWLWRTVLANTDIANYATRLMIMGRNALVKTEGWRKLQQDRTVLFEQTIERFDRDQTNSYLAQAGITDEAKIANIYTVTKGLPYYLNWIRKQWEQGQDLDFAQGNQEIVRLLLQGLNNTQQQLVQLASCCRQFNSRLIRVLTEQVALDFATAVDEERNCFGWLVQLSFVEPAKGQFRLDDVARDVFHQAFWLTDVEQFEQIHGELATYFLKASDREVPTNASPPDQYESPEWRTARVEYLYHLLLSRQDGIQIQLLTHLLAGRYLQQDELMQRFLAFLNSDFSTWERLPFSSSTRQFCQTISPAVQHGWAVLEESPIDYPNNLRLYGLAQAEIDRAVQVCLGTPDALDGLAKYYSIVL